MLQLPTLSPAVRVKLARVTAPAAVSSIRVGVPFQSDSAPQQMPNMVWLYRVPILLYWAEHDEALGAIITHVLVHEIGHHFGLSDEDMERIEAEAEG